MAGVAAAVGGWCSAHGDPAATPTEPPVDVRFGPVDAAVVEQRGSDLRIMGRVLERAVRPAAGREQPVGFRMGIPMWVSGGTEGVRAAYLEGFGALFTLKVDMPLVPPRSKTATVTTNPAASDWDAARREVQGEPGDPGASDVPVAYDARLMDQLRERLVAALRQATNLRHLAAGEVVAVVAEGPAADAVDSGAAAAEGQAGTGPSSVAAGGDVFTSSVGGGGGSAVYFESGGGSGSGRRSFRWSTGRPAPGWNPSGAGLVGFEDGEGFSRLTVRVRKSDLEALAAGTFSGEAWTKAVSFQTSTGTGSGIAGRTGPLF